MISPWPEIRKFYSGLVASGVPLQGMLSLVEQIESSGYVLGIYGWTSMHDLAITQSPNWTYPDMSPYLRIVPQFNGFVEFRYVDTHIVARQWNRVVEEGMAFGRLERFFDQLHWFSRAE